MVRRWYNLQSGPPNNFSTRLAPYVVIAILLTIFPMRFFTSSWLFCNSQSVLLHPFTFLTLSSNSPPLRQPSVCSLHLWVCSCLVSLFCSLDYTYKLNYMAFIFLWLISLSIIPFSCIHVVANGKISLFLCLSNIPLCICTTTIIFILTWGHFFFALRERETHRQTETLMWETLIDCLPYMRVQGIKPTT